MSKGLDPEFLAQLKSKIDLVELVGSYVPLERKGGNWWGRCPFHHEKTPSFTVNADNQFYHCFGCGASGDAITFIREIESVDFMDAVKMLAERAKVPMPELNFDSEQILEQKKKRDNLLKILRTTAHFYLDNLNSGKADAHIQYILDRKISASVVRKFGLGASLNFQDLPQFLLDSGFSRQDILDSGVVTESEKNHRLIDAQGGRLIFPSSMLSGTSLRSAAGSWKRRISPNTRTRAKRWCSTRAKIYTTSIRSRSRKRRGF